MGYPSDQEVVSARTIELQTRQIECLQYQNAQLDRRLQVANDSLRVRTSVQHAIGTVLRLPVSIVRSAGAYNARRKIKRLERALSVRDSTIQQMRARIKELSIIPKENAP